MRADNSEFGDFTGSLTTWRGLFTNSLRGTAHETSETVARARRAAKQSTAHRNRLFALRASWRDGARGPRGNRRDGAISRGEPATDAARNHGVHGRDARI